ncbi:hypothetical protein CEP50_18470 [Actinopolyspora mortivallis]|uniref:MFS transporter n=2 Tax=Actinopolyspora mortivallis TaxID=33906 RepID=A0A2T0GRZ7_ACTMO|nr:hypothetical protein CEP50_18470 [Actinopolyspora mortivallis]
MIFGALMSKNKNVTYTRNRSGFFDALRYRDFTLVAGGQLVSAIGDGVLPVAVSLALLQRGDGVAAVGSILAARSIAMGFALLIGGIVADRFSRNRVMVGSDIIRALAVIAIIYLLMYDYSAAFISIMMLVFGLGEAFFRPAFRGIYPHILPDDLLQQANAWGSLVSRTAATIGPALGGALVASVSPIGALWFDVVTFGISALTLLFVRLPVSPSGNGKVGLRNIKDGALVIVRRRWLGLCFAAGLIQKPASVAPWLVLLPSVALDRYNSSFPYATSMSLYAVGAIVGAVVSSKIRISIPGVPAIIGVSTFSLIMAAMLLPVPALVLILAHFLAGIGLEVYGVMWNTAIHREIPKEMLGRVTSFEMLGSACLMPIGYTFAGAWAEIHGNTIVLSIAAIVCIVTTFPLLVDSSVRRLGSMEDENDKKKCSEEVASER